MADLSTRDSRLQIVVAAESALEAAAPVLQIALDHPKEKVPLGLLPGRSRCKSTSISASDQTLRASKAREDAMNTALNAVEQFPNAPERLALPPQERCAEQVRQLGLDVLADLRRADADLPTLKLRPALEDVRARFSCHADTIPCAISECLRSL